MFEEHDDAYRSHCELCGQDAPVVHVTFRQNIGLLVMRLSSAATGWFCRDCIQQEFWRRTLITLFFGPWGVISFFVTPIFVLMNIGQYFSVRSLPRGAGSGAAQRKSGRWVLPAIVAGGMVLACPAACLVSVVVIGGAMDDPTAQLARACDGQPVASAAPLAPGAAPGVVMMENDGLGWLASYGLLPASMRAAYSTEEASLVLCVDEVVPSTIETCNASGATVTRSVLLRRGRLVVARTGVVVGESVARGDEPGPCPLTASYDEVLEGEDPIDLPSSLEAAFGPLVLQARQGMQSFGASEPSAALGR